MDKLERVARALASAGAMRSILYRLDGAPMTLEEHVDITWPQYRYPARLAIEALEEFDAPLMLAPDHRTRYGTLTDGYDGILNGPSSPNLPELLDPDAKSTVGSFEEYPPQVAE